MFHKRLREYHKIGSIRHGNNIKQGNNTDLEHERASDSTISNNWTYSPIYSASVEKIDTSSSYVKSLQTLKSSKDLSLEDILSDYIEVYPKKLRNSQNSSPFRKYIGTKSPINSNTELPEFPKSPNTYKNKKLSYKYYDTLGISQGSTIEQIKRAYRNKATKLHPDKNRHNLSYGDNTVATTAFQELQEAYELLSNQTKKAIYDEYGDDALKFGLFNHLRDVLPSKEEIQLENTFFNTNNVPWSLYWMDIIESLFINPLTQRQGAELHSLNALGISMNLYEELLKATFKYIKKSEDIPRKYFENPLIFPQIPDLYKRKFKIVPSIFSRLNENLESIPVEHSNFNYIQIFGRPNDLLINSNKNIESEYESIFNLNKQNIKSIFGFISTNSESAWKELIISSKRQYKVSSTISQTNSLKRQLQKIISKYNWIIVLFVPESFLPFSDSEFLLQLQNDTFKRQKNRFQDISNKSGFTKEIESLNIDELLVFPVPLYKPKVSDTNNQPQIIIRPYSYHIYSIIQQILLISNDETHFIPIEVESTD
ncbi:DnaJ domain-containing protein [Cryptosporidium muris RN66]|uniref:DnaJ domain-containing protein n=1 Tax=Cryptosporidium muris (strain RN66) TaxID=441375 RepID=B6AJ02_CRYMR|nr:DnaJ domain-containing protein [Cryptosporidium muris RN66]EEA08193.1 DnaJ domain-containing protein [Cryptosporidium muris RN66]|eukprot:XP_002142542.1 DnaJ domain-containing protein [Cryptosporidium muris RN66]